MTKLVVWGAQPGDEIIGVLNKVIPVLLLLQTTKGHLGARNVLLGVFEVRELAEGLATWLPEHGLRWTRGLETNQSIVVPGYAL